MTPREPWPQYSPPLCFPKCERRRAWWGLPGQCGYPYDRHHHCDDRHHSETHSETLGCFIWPNLWPPDQGHLQGTDSKFISDAETGVNRRKDQNRRLKWLKNLKAEPLVKSAPKRLWQISSTFHFPNYSPTSLPTGTFLKINKPQPDTCVNHWPGRQELAGYGRDKRPPLTQLDTFRIQNLEMQKQTLKNKEGRENNPQNWLLLHHHVSKFTK